MNTTSNKNNHHLLHSLSLHHSLQKSKRSVLALLSLLLLFLLAYNVATVFSFQVPFLPRIPPESASFSPENVSGKSAKWRSSSTKLSSTVMYAVKEENPPSIPKNHLPILQKPHDLVVLRNDSVVFSPKRMRRFKLVLKILRSEVRAKLFSTRVKEFLDSNSCKLRFFMTWISSLDSFGDRELLTIQSLFKFHPNACLIIVSNSMDSRRGMQVLRPFLDKNFRVIAVSPDFNYLFKNTVAETWFNRLKKGNVDPGDVSLGQNLSNLLRLALLYKYGGIYIDTDVLILKSFAKLSNSIGAQTIDVKTGNWSRLNNAVMIFDKGHPLLYKFIEEFARTFNGNKWGYNGPYLVSRVVSRVEGKPGFDFHVLNPIAFYPVDWSRISGLFRGPRNKAHSKWFGDKLNRIRSQSYTVHLWNRQSRKLAIEEGSIIGHIMSDCCVFCNSSASNVVST